MASKAFAFVLFWALPPYSHPLRYAFRKAGIEKYPACAR